MVRWHGVPGVLVWLMLCFFIAGDVMLLEEGTVCFGVLFLVGTFDVIARSKKSI